MQQDGLMLLLRIGQHGPHVYQHVATADTQVG
jgi:hypothetical protein